MFDPSAQYELSVCPLGRTPADEYYHQGQVWIEGREGSTYTLRFTNRSNARVLAILSVDGLDVLNGNPAGHLSDGYVVDPGSTIDVPGWKVDGSTAAEFFFSKVGKSYVTKSGKGSSNAGVIGAMVFTEAQPIWTQSPFTYVASPQVTHTGAVWTNHGYNSTGGHPGVPAMDASFGGSAAPSAINMVSVTRGPSGTTVANQIGTGFGQATGWATASTTFNRAHPTVPNAIMAVFYDTAKYLQRRGIVLKSKYSTSTSNNPFPAYTGSRGAVPPPGWKP
jgi:hypothetical protein